MNSIGTTDYTGFVWAWRLATADSSSIMATAKIATLTRRSRELRRAIRTSAATKPAGREQSSSNCACADGPRGTRRVGGEPAREHTASIRRSPNRPGYLWRRANHPWIAGSANGASSGAECVRVAPCPWSPDAPGTISRRDCELRLHRGCAIDARNWIGAMQALGARVDRGHGLVLAGDWRSHHGFADRGSACDRQGHSASAA